jgi:hypothetical protein
MLTSPTSGRKPAIPADATGNARIERLRAGAPDGGGHESARRNW